ncbi:MAG: phosphoribosyl-AMP cyclohydrolase, partial [Campylobacter sp.]|nr:phosphoribosyl-AMP cyclohydrolase [Campylobacter sp.]
MHKAHKDRRNRGKMKIDWEKTGGLLPVVVQDVASSEVLMLAYMDEEALNLSLETGFAHYFSRTKNRIWKKGEQSGNVQKIEDAYLDCDNDTLLIKVEQKGGTACHTGAKSCFFRKIADA